MHMARSQFSLGSQRMTHSQFSLGLRASLGTWPDWQGESSRSLAPGRRGGGMQEVVRFEFAADLAHLARPLPPLSTPSAGPRLPFASHATTQHNTAKRSNTQQCVFSGSSSSSVFAAFSIPLASSAFAAPSAPPNLQHFPHREHHRQRAYLCAGRFFWSRWDGRPGRALCRPQ